MGTFQELVDKDHIFETSLSSQPIILNDKTWFTEAERADLDRLMYTTYQDTEMLSVVPKCDCGQTKGKRKEGRICVHCGHEVKARVEDNIEAKMWIRAPDGIDGLIDITVWNMFDKSFTKSGFEPIYFLTDPYYRHKGRQTAIERDLTEWLEIQKIDRGLNNFIRHFDEIMDYMFNHPEYRSNTKVKVREFEIFIRQNRSKLFPTKLPIPNSSVLIVDQTNLGRYIDKSTPGLIDAIRTMAGIDASVTPLSLKKKESKTVKAIALISKFGDETNRENIAEKTGLARKHIYGTRCDYSFRGVITSITGPHQNTDLHLPWGMALQVLRQHLLSKMLRGKSKHLTQRYNPRTAVIKLDAHTYRFCPELYGLMTEMIDESIYDGIPTVFQRNPSLERASAQLFFIVKIKKNPNDVTVSLPILSVKGMNADFDGDELNGTLPLDNFTTEGLFGLLPHKSTYSFDEPWEVSVNVSLSTPVSCMISNWLHHEDRHEVDKKKLRLMEELFER